MAGRVLRMVALGVAAALMAIAVARLPAEAGPGTATDDETQPTSRKCRIVYSAQLDVPANTERVRLWLPLPVSSPQQEVSEIQVLSKGSYHVYTDPVYANRVLCVDHPTPAEGPVTLSLTATVRRAAYRVLDGPVAPAHGLSASEALAPEFAPFLGPNALVPITGRVQAEAASVVRPGMSNLEKARAMYNHLTGTFAYDKSAPGYGRGDAVRACDVRKGNCSDVHSLFIGMSRATGLPARLHMGFPLPPDKASGEAASYHCWADFHVPNVGWVPVDISEAIKAPERHEELFGGLDANRIHFATGRDIVLCPGPTPGPQNILIYPVATVDGQVTEPSWQFRFEGV
ncbi:MAG: transglutaminase-like domain-containing protein [Planctomycetota bacterium]|jgi:transglutaminase-like putative cysteine protease